VKTTVLISGIRGFAGSTLAGGLARRGHAVQGFDNLIRAGSEAHRARL
jgi:nucleoside-diphosphate-sugar epimerase